MLAQNRLATRALIGSIILMLLLCGSLAWRSFNPEIMSKTELQMSGAMLLHSSIPLSDFRLVDHLNQPFHPDRLKGVWSIIFFAFTNCPDICPTTLSTLSSMYSQMSLSERNDLQIYMVSLDTGRDTTHRLSQYVPYFNSDFVGITGEQDSVGKFATELNVAYRQVQLDENNYTIDHGTQLILINPRGEYHAFFKSPHSETMLLQSWRSIVGMGLD